MPDGFDVGDVVKKLKDQFQKPSEQPPQWSIWGDSKPTLPAQPAQPGQLPPGFPQPGLPPGGFRPGDTQAPPRPDQPPPRVEPLPGPPLRPEQQMGTGRADQRTQETVTQLVGQAKNQSYRSQSAKLFTKAIEMSNQSGDPTLQAVSKVEYGLAHMSWGYGQEGFKWILEAGSNNPSIYDMSGNQSFLQRLATAGMPEGAVKLLLAKGKEDPTWYTKDPDAAKKLDSAMSGPAFIAPQNPDGPARPRPGADPFAPPTTRPDQVNPNLDPPPPGQNGTWIREQINTALRNANQEKNFNSAFGIYRQAVDMADRARDPAMQATTRVETGLALMSVGNLESGFKWLLDAGSKNPGLYDSRVNKGFVDRLSSAGMPREVVAELMSRGAKDPHWHMTDLESAKKMEALMRNPNPPKPIAPVVPIQPIAPRIEPAPQPGNDPPRRKSPFG